MSVHEVYPYLRVSDGRAAIAFYQAAFGATERFRLVDPAGARIGHAELAFGTRFVVMLSDAYPEMGLNPPGEGGTGLSIHLHVDNADEVIARAVQAGATLTRPPTDQFYGERGGAVRDPFGHEWLIGHNIEEVSPEEMQRRWDAMV